VRILLLWKGIFFINAPFIWTLRASPANFLYAATFNATGFLNYEVDNVLTGIKAVKFLDGNLDNFCVLQSTNQ
jgi:hypothetical protein